MIETLNSWGSLWLTWFLPAVMQNTVFLALLLLLLYRVREYTAQFKYSLGMIGICKLLLPPFLPARLKAAAEAVTADLSADIAALGSTPPPPPPPADWVPPAPQLTVPGIIITVWLTFLLLYICYILFTTARLKHFLKHAQPVDAQIPELTGTNIQVLESARITMPLSLGPFTRTIYVPRLWQQWSESCRAMVLRHEIAHIQRKDGLLQLLQLLMQAVYFFHPLVHILNKQINEYREMACDDMSAGPKRETSLEYSRYLVEIAEKLVHDPVSCGSASALIRQKHELVKRITYQISEAPMKTLPTARKRVITGGLILLIIPLSWYYTSARPMQQQSKTITIEKPDGKTSSITYPKGKIQDGFSLVGVHINKNNTYTFLDKSYTPDDISSMIEALKRTMGKFEDPVIGISADAGVTMGIVNDLHTALVASDLLKITYVDQKGDNFSLMLPPSSARETLETSAKDHIYQVWINGDSNLLIGKNPEPGSADKLREAAGKIIEKDDKIIFSIKTSATTPFHSYLNILGILKNGGAKRIVVDNPPPPSKPDANPAAPATTPPPPPPGK
ncbi:M56 family metallopeptidase [bacterium]|nr:M56 family metallopeptidase [bacterium]